MAREKTIPLLIGIIVIGVIVGGFAIFLAGGASSYGQTYNTTQIELLNKVSDMNKTAQDLADGLQRASNPRGGLAGFIDLMGGIGASLYNTMLIMWQNISFMFEISATGVGLLGLGSFSGLLILGLITSIIIIIGIIVMDWFR